MSGLKLPNIVDKLLEFERAHHVIGNAATANLLGDARVEIERLREAVKAAYQRGKASSSSRSQVRHGFSDMGG